MYKKIITFMIISGFTVVFIAHADRDIGSRSQNGDNSDASLADNISNWQPADSAIEVDNPIQVDSYNPPDPEFDIVEYDNFEDKRKEAMRMNDKILKGDDDYDDDVADDLGDEDDEPKGKGHERRVGGEDHQGKHKGWANNKHQNRSMNGEAAQLGTDNSSSNSDNGKQQQQQQSSQQSQTNADLLNQIDNHMTNGAYYDNVTADPMQW